MVQLKQVNKPKSEIKLNKKLEREDELQKKFSQLSEEDHVLKAYEASKKKVNILLFLDVYSDVVYFGFLFLVYSDKFSTLNPL